MSDPRDVPAGTPAGSANGKRKRRMTARWRHANRLNARASTGPQSAAGKARVARNALRHGLSVWGLDDPEFAPEIVQLARTIEQSVAGESLDGADHEFACRIAETFVDLRRARLAKLPLVAEVEADLQNCAGPLAQLWRLDRYAQRTAARRERAVRAFYEAVTGLPVPKALRQNKAMQGIARMSEAGLER